MLDLELDESFFPICVVCSLECFPTNLTSEARLTFSNTSTGNKNHNQFNMINITLT